MKKHLLTAAIVLGTVAPAALAVRPAEPDTMFIPERAVVLSGDRTRADREVMAVFYSRENLAYTDPHAPRFLLLDREGKMAFGIGGQLYATASYDFKGAVDGPGFTTYDIAVPQDPALRQRFGTDLSHSSLFLRLVGKTTRFGFYQVYVQANFTGNGGQYGFKLKQAYVGLGHLTAGLTNSTFVDPATQAPTVDTEGPSGQIADKNILFRYTTPVYKGLSAALSVEHPTVSYTDNARNGSIAQRVPDIPAYVQYSWAEGQHVRASAIFRDMAYRDYTTGRNCLKAGWGVQLSTIGNFDPQGVVQFFGHIAYGCGIGQYVNDLGGNGYDLVYDGRDGAMVAPRMMGWAAGVYVNPTKKLTLTGCFSRAQVYGLSDLGATGYRYGQYAVANSFYDFGDGFTVGAEYIHGWRKDYNNLTGAANRINLLLQFQF